MYGWLTANSPGALQAEVTYRREQLSRDWGSKSPSWIRSRRQARHARAAAARAIPEPRSATRHAERVGADR